MRAIIMHVSDIYGGYYQVPKRDWIISFSDTVERAFEYRNDPDNTVDFVNDPMYGHLRVFDGSEMIVNSEWRAEEIELCEHGNMNTRENECPDCRFSEAENEHFYGWDQD